MVVCQTHHFVTCVLFISLGVCILQPKNLDLQNRFVAIFTTASLCLCVGERNLSEDLIMFVSLLS